MPCPHRIQAGGHSRLRLKVCRGLEPESNEFESLHAEVESGAIQSQSLRCTAWTGQNPSCLLQGRHDMLPLDLFQSLAPLIIVPSCNTGMKVSEQNPQHWTGREDHCTFDYILQFANVSRPLVLRQ